MGSDAICSLVFSCIRALGIMHALQAAGKRSNTVWRSVLCHQQIARSREKEFAAGTCLLQDIHLWRFPYARFLSEVRQVVVSTNSGCVRGDTVPNPIKKKRNQFLNMKYRCVIAREITKKLTLVKIYPRV